MASLYSPVGFGDFSFPQNLQYGTIWSHQSISRTLSASDVSASESCSLVQGSGRLAWICNNDPSETSKIPTSFLVAYSSLQPMTLMSISYTYLLMSNPRASVTLCRYTFWHHSINSANIIAIIFLRLSMLR